MDNKNLPWGLIDHFPPRGVTGKTFCFQWERKANFEQSRPLPKRSPIDPEMLWWNVGIDQAKIYVTRNNACAHVVCLLLILFPVLFAILNKNLADGRPFKRFPPLALSSAIPSNRTQNFGAS